MNADLLLKGVVIGSIEGLDLDSIIEEISSDRRSWGYPDHLRFENGSTVPLH